VRTGTQTLDIRLMADIFNLFNTNAALSRNGSLASNAAGTIPNPSFNLLTKNVSPRILRLGLNIGF
jgi:hypothetical protein